MKPTELKQMSDSLSSLRPETVVVAINGKRNSKYVIKWALDNFLPKESVFKLLHVCVKITSVPTPMGRMPIDKVREDIVHAYKQEVEWKTTEMLALYKRMFLERKAQVDELKIEGDDDIANTIANEVAKGRVDKLVIGASSRGGMFTRKVNGEKPSSRITEIIPSYCTVYAVSKGKLVSVRESSSETSGSIRDDNSVTSSSKVSNYQTEDEADFPSFSNHSDRVSASSRTNSFQRQNHSWISDTGSEAGSEAPSENEYIMSSELEKLINELRRTRGIYAIAQSETLEASRKLNEMIKGQLVKQDMCKEVRFKDEQAEEVVKPEKEKYEDAKREVNHVSECDAQREALEREEAETKSAQYTREKENLQVPRFDTLQQYKKFTWEEIVTATSSFSEKLIIGKGAAGTVYKCNLRHTTAAVKVLHSREVQSRIQFQQELEILGRIRHPHLVLHLGACPEQGCIVYEYMENGSLEDRLLRKNSKKSPIPWFDRFRIAAEIASGLVFLHTSKPKRIIHRDLKPANILLDRNLCSKIGDVGLSKMIQSQSMYNRTASGGTISYLDPDYQIMGTNSPKSDVYAFGLVLLQLLTAKSTSALSHMIETAVDDDTLVNLLDYKAGQWPLEEAKELAILGLNCAELRGRDRPDLKTQVLPTLERLRAAADRARNATHINLPAPPSHFLCPITKELMNEPCVASDGYTYDREAIETWLEASDKSPMTNATLPTKNLIPIFTLVSAISQWKSERS